MKWLLAVLMILTPGSPWLMKWAAVRKVRQHMGSDAPDTSAVYNMPNWRKLSGLARYRRLLSLPTIA